MIFEFAQLWEASDYTLTLTGSYLQDRELYPTWWKCVSEAHRIQRYAEEIVNNTLDLVGNEG